MVKVKVFNLLCWNSLTHSNNKWIIEGEIFFCLGLFRFAWRILNSHWIGLTLSILGKLY